MRNSRLGVMTALAAAASLEIGLSLGLVARSRKEHKQIPRPVKKPEPYKAKVKTGSADKRADKYLHASARRRRAALRDEEGPFDL